MYTNKPILLFPFVTPYDPERPSKTIDAGVEYTSLDAAAPFVLSIKDSYFDKPRSV